MSTPEQDIEFLEACLKKAQESHRMFFELLPCDLAPVSDDRVSSIDVPTHNRVVFLRAMSHFNRLSPLYGRLFPHFPKNSILGQSGAF